MDSEQIERGIARLEQYANKPVADSGWTYDPRPWPSVLPGTAV